MSHTPGPQTTHELDRILRRLRSLIDASAKGEKETHCVRISLDDVRWLLAEIDGGREAFAAIVEQKVAALSRISALERTVDSLLSMRNELHGELRKPRAGQTERASK
ncbi:hypothetical protein [Cupriavidus sp. TMH.W2]|uniref:hypothetical protein n=1 Tax=Cupriavidus sp. TMH.W2 TaxID=3434465 RepID=UPI003D77C4D8